MNVGRNVERLHHWLREVALPLWADSGVDHQHGGFYESLDFSGEPLTEQHKRMRVQGRQIYTYSHSALLGFNDHNTDVARKGFEFLTKHYWHEDGGWIFSVHRDGTPKALERESYEQAFALLGFAWYYRASKDERVIPWIEKTIAFLDSLWDASNGGYRESVTGTSPRRQNPHMHLLEAFLALHETFKDKKHLDSAVRIIELATEKFFDPETLALGEFYQNDWSRAEGIPGQILEPGHHFEWVWLLQKFMQATNTDALTKNARALFKIAESSGVETQTGLAYNEMHRDGNISDASKRTWPQTEALKANLVYPALVNTVNQETRSEQIIDLMFEHYLKVNGTWQDVVNAENEGTGTMAPASTMYHLFVAFDEYLRLHWREDYSFATPFQNT